MTGSERARIEGQLGTVLYWKGDLATAATHLRRSAAELAVAGDVVAEARYRGNLGAVLALLGDLTDAEHELQPATELAEREGLDLVAGAARANLGFVATLRGDLPGALDEFTRAEAVYRRAKADSMLPRLHADHAQALADAGLFEDADALVQTGVAMYEQQGQTTELAGALLTSAEIKLAHGDAAGATAAADDAARRFAEQDRATWAVAAHALALQARARSGSDDSAALSNDLVEVAATLRAQGWQRDATRCLLVAARLAVESGRPSGIDSALRSAVEHGRTADRVLLDYVDAVEALNASDATAARRSITHGLRVATSAQAEMGSIEMRAHAAVYGAELTVLGARIAVAAGRPRELLERIEASRVLSSRTPSIRPAQDEELAAALAELRGLDMTVADPATSDDQRAGAEERRQRLEAEIGRRARRTRGTGSDAAGIAAEVATVLTMLGDRQLLAHAALDGELLAVTVSEGRVRLHRLGTLERTREQLDSITFALHRLNRLQGSDDARIAAAELMFAAAAELAEHALPPDIAQSDAPVVIVPTGVLHDVPWGLLTPLAGREVSVNPSLAAWARATQLRAERSSRRARGAAARIHRRARSRPRRHRGGGAERAVRRGERAHRRRRHRRGEPGDARALRPGARRVPRLVPPGQPDVLGVAPRRRAAQRVRPRAGRSPPRRGGAVGVQRRRGDDVAGGIAARVGRRADHPRSEQRRGAADPDLRRLVGDGDATAAPRVGGRRHPGRGARRGHHHPRPGRPDGRLVPLPRRLTLAPSTPPPAGSTISTSKIERLRTISRPRIGR